MDETDLVERQIAVVHIPRPHVHPSMMRMRHAIHAHLKLARPQGRTLWIWNPFDVDHLGMEFEIKGVGTGREAAISLLG